MKLIKKPSLILLTLFLGYQIPAHAVSQYNVTVNTLGAAPGSNFDSVMVRQTCERRYCAESSMGEKCGSGVKHDYTHNDSDVKPFTSGETVTLQTNNCKAAKSDERSETDRGYVTALEVLIQNEANGDAISCGMVSVDTQHHQYNFAGPVNVTLQADGTCSTETPTPIANESGTDNYQTPAF